MNVRDTWGMPYIQLLLAVALCFVAVTAFFWISGLLFAPPPPQKEPTTPPIVKTYTPKKELLDQAMEFQSVALRIIEIYGMMIEDDYARKADEYGPGTDGRKYYLLKDQLAIKALDNVQQTIKLHRAFLEEYKKEAK